MSFPESIPLRREPQGEPMTAGTELAWLGLFIPLALIAILVLRRVQRQRGSSTASSASCDPKSMLGWLKGNSQGTLLLRESRRLTQTHSVHEVEWRGRTLLIGCSSQSIQLLGELPVQTQDAVAAKTAAGEPQ